MSDSKNKQQCQCENPKLTLRTNVSQVSSKAQWWLARSVHKKKKKVVYCELCWLIFPDQNVKTQVAMDFFKPLDDTKGDE